MKYRKKPVIVEATQWFQSGDHPQDGELPEGKIVKYYLGVNQASSPQKCKHCEVPLEFHGWIETLEGGHIVCSGDFIITGVKGEHYPCKPDIFHATYEAV